MSSAMESCVGKTYAEITAIFTAKHGNTTDILRIDAKWRNLGKSMR